MYVFRYQPLKDQLKKRQVSDRQALPYLLWFCGLEAVSIPSFSTANKWDILGTMLYVVVVVLGVFYVYLRNGGRAGYDVIHKIVVLGAVVGFRYLLAAIPVGGLAYLAASYFGLTGDQTTFFDAVFFTVLNALYFERLGRHIVDTNETKVEAVPQELQQGTQASGLVRVVRGGSSNNR